jgi:hypothetical protein
MIAEGIAAMSKQVYEQFSDAIKKGEYDEPGGLERIGLRRFFNAIDASRAIHALTIQQGDALWKAYFDRQAERVLRLRAKQHRR